MRLIAMQGVALNAVLLAIRKQPGIDAERLTQDISDALMFHEVNGETKPEGLPRATANDYIVIRAMMKQVLPDLPIR